MSIERADREATLARMVEMRRHLHRHPELAWDEHETAALVADRLAALGIDNQTGQIGTAVVGTIGDGSHPVIGLRADMDAIAFDDLKDVPYRSTVDGVAHLCGHDAHVAMLLGAAEMLAAADDLPAGTIKLVFEPAEEIMVGDTPTGAGELMASGLLDDLNTMVGCHVYPDYPTGTLAVRAGSMLTGMDVFDVVVSGIDSHTAQAHQGRDAILATSAVIEALHAVFGRRHPTDAVGSMNVGVIEGGRYRNIVPSRVSFSGSVRTADEKWRDGLEAWFRSTVRSIAEAHGCTADIDYVSRQSPATINNPRIVELLIDAAATVEGVTIHRMAEPRLAAETFRHYADRVPSAIWLLGVGNPDKDISHPSHSQHFDLDEDALLVGAEISAAAARRLLEVL